MTFTVKIKCDNAAFGDDPGAEVGRILHKLAHVVERSPLCKGDTFPLVDENGNKVGEAKASSR
jgi:hypothetical protein